jgi:hypothetical protein
MLLAGHYEGLHSLRSDDLRKNIPVINENRDVILLTASKISVKTGFVSFREYSNNITILGGSYAKNKIRHYW